MALEQRYNTDTSFVETPEENLNVGAEVVNPTQTNQSTAYNDILRALSDASSTAGKNEALPPQYYYPGLAPQGVQVGQTSTPIGTFSLFSPGAPLFPYNILDAVEKEQQNKKKAAIDEYAKGIGSFEIKHMLNPNLDKGFVDVQLNEFGKLHDFYMKQVNDGTLDIRIARQKFGQEVKNMTAKHESFIKQSDALFKTVNDIQNTDPSKTYVHPLIRKEADNISKLSTELFTDNNNDLDKIFNSFTKAGNRLYKAQGMELASAELRKTINESIYQNPILEEVYIKSGGDYTKAQSTIQDMLIQIEKGGLSAFDTEDLNNKILASYNVNYGGAAARGENAAPTFEEYKDYVLTHTKEIVKQNLQTLSKSNEWEKFDYYKKKKELDETQLETTKLNIAGQEVESTGLPITKKPLVISGTNSPIFEVEDGKIKLSKQTDISGIASAKINKVNINGVEHTLYEVVPAETYTLKDGTVTIRYEAGAPKYVLAEDYENAYQKYLKENKLTESNKVVEGMQKTTDFQNRNISVPTAGGKAQTTTKSPQSGQGGGTSR